MPNSDPIVRIFANFQLKINVFFDVANNDTSAKFEVYTESFDQVAGQGALGTYNWASG